MILPCICGENDTKARFRKCFVGLTGHEVAQ